MQSLNRVALSTLIFFFFGITAVSFFASTYHGGNHIVLAVSDHKFSSSTGLDSVFNTTGGQAIGLYFSNTDGNIAYFVKVALYESVILISNCNRVSCGTTSSSFKELLSFHQ
jgi:hypothetical protein